MCTVTYIPSASGFILTSNRDESATRNAVSLTSIRSQRDEKVWFPQDTLRGGSWFAVGEAGRAGCILNGAFEPYAVERKWPRSRGIMLLEMFDYEDTNEFADSFPFELVAPFTMLILENGFFEEWKFDGEELQRRKVDHLLPQIWSSVTLYPEPVRQARRQAFGHFLEEHFKPEPADLIRFHSSQPFGDEEYDFIMKRGEKVQTVSITQFVRENENARIFHKDLIGERELKEELHP